MILLYHHIMPLDQVPGKCDQMERLKLYLTPEQLESQLLELKSRGFRFVRLSDLVSTIVQRGWEPWKQVAITFDDGCVDNYIHAFPILQKLNVPATFFVTTGHLHNGIQDPKKMTVEQLKDLLRCGMTIGAHSRTHPNLLNISELQAREEICGSKKDLEQALQIPVDFFAYPYGAHHRTQIDMVRAAGYTAAFSAGGGAQNTRLGLFWFYRYGLSARMDSLEDRQAFNPVGGSLRGLYRDLRKKLGYPILAALGAGPKCP